MSLPDQSAETTAILTGPVTLNAAPTFSDAGGPFTLGHVNFGGTVDGAQALNFTGSSNEVTFTGLVGNATALTSLTTSPTSAATTLNTALVKTSGTQTYNNPVTVGAAANLTATNVTLGHVTLNDTLTTTVSGTTSVMTGVVSGPGGLRMGGTGRLTLSGANTYTGKTTVVSGTLSVGSLNSVSGGAPSSNLGAPRPSPTGLSNSAAARPPGSCCTPARAKRPIA